MHEQGVVAPVKAKIVIQRHKALEYPFAYHLLNRVKRQRQLLLSARYDVDNVAQISCVRSPRLRSLLVRKDLDKRKIVHGRGMAAHFQPAVEQVVLLIGFICRLLYLLELQVVSALFAYLRYRHHTELETAAIRVVLNHLFAKAQHVEVQDMRVPIHLSTPLRKEVRRPQRKIAGSLNFVIRAYRIVGHDEA